MKAENWTFSEAWNAALLDTEKRPAKARDNLWASELGKAPIDLYLKMTGVEPTNPPNARSLRKFEAGNVFEWIVALVLKRAGILQASQKWSSYQYPSLLKVTGKADFIAGGKPNFDKALSELQQLELPEIFVKATARIKKHFEEKYPDGLAEKPLEIKSVSSFMFDLIEFNKNASKMHRIQTFHYLKAENRSTANIIYICRDDLRMIEVPVLNPSKVEDEYKQAIEKISKYYLKGEKPPLEKAIVFDEDFGKFAKNFNVAYSGYLTMLYGFTDQKEFDDKYIPIVARWNRVINRVVKGDKITDKNKLVLAEITDASYDTKEIASKFSGSNEDEE